MRRPSLRCKADRKGSEGNAPALGSREPAQKKRRKKRDDARQRNVNINDKNRACRNGDEYRNVIVNGLGPSEKVDEPVKGSQLASKDLLPLDVIGKIVAFKVVDGDDTAGSVATKSPMSA